MAKIPKHTLLIIDDEEAEIMNLTDILQDDYILHAATNGDDAIRLAAQHSPDIIILDALMPDADGLSVITELKKAETTSAIPVLFTVEQNSKHNIETGLSLGAADYIIKPFSPAMLKLRIENRLLIMQQVETIERLSLIDTLTDLPNRRSFDERFDSEWRRAMRDKLPLSVMLIDVDRFKNYNEIFGYHQGNTALQSIAEILKKLLKRTGDFASRRDGEEFAVLVANTDAAGALMLAEKIRKSIELAEIPCPEGFTDEDSKITVSIGLNTFNHDTELNKTSFISGAARALFMAKHDGRNRVRVYQHTSGTAGLPKQKKMIFVVDNDAAVLNAAENILSGHYRVVTIPSADKMYQAFDKFTLPDLIILSIDEQPELDTLAHLKSSNVYSEVPVICMARAQAGESTFTRAIELGAIDCVTKNNSSASPFTAAVLSNRVRYHLQFDELIRERTARLTERKQYLLENRDALMLLQNGLVFTLAAFVENHDLYTAGHIDRICVYMRHLIKAMITNDVYSDEMSDWELDAVVSAAGMHDIGKIAVPDNILNKPGKLTEEEFDIVKTHPGQSEFVFRVIRQRAGNALLLNYAEIIAVNHHERWDGTGYPSGLKGTDIPLPGRIMAVVDVYDALRSERSYKPPMPYTQAMQIITDGAGTQFDPDIVKVFAGLGQSKLSPEFGVR